MKQTSSSVTQLIILIMMLLLMMSEICSPARKGGSRRRGKHRKQHTGSTKLIAISPKMRAYYEHKDGAEIVKSSFFDYEFDLGHKIVFICVAKGDPAPKITWYKEGIEIFQHPFVQITERQLTDNRVQGKLEIDPALQMDAGAYECWASNKYRIDKKAFKADFAVMT